MKRQRIFWSLMVLLLFCLVGGISTTRADDSPPEWFDFTPATGTITGFLGPSDGSVTINIPSTIGGSR